MNKEQIRKVIGKFINQNDDLANQDALLQLIRDQELLVLEVLNEMQEETYNVPDEGEKEQMLATLQKVLSVDKVEYAPVVPMNKISRKKWYWAAASVLVALMAALYFLLPHPGSVPTTIVKNKVPEPVNDVAPGGNKAILTLADGSQIVLDTAGNGNIVRQGNVSVIKLADGRLSYDKKAGSNAEIAYNTISTPRGGQYQVILADGSKVWLNAESSLRFPTVFAGHERNVELTGEGYFEIAHDASQPFIVHANETAVTVLGTHFNVNSYKDEPDQETTLLEGSVQLSNAGAVKILKPGQQGKIARGGGIAVTPVDVDEVVAWKNGKFTFDNANVYTIMRQLARWYDIQVVYERQGLDNELFVGSISRNVNCSSILEMLEKTGALDFEIVGKKVIVK